MATTATAKSAKKRSSFASCLACRAQHCACDEVRPCNRCSRLGITCTEGVSRKAKAKQPHYQLDTPTTNTLLSVPYTDLEKELFLDRPELHFQPANLVRTSPAISQSLLSTSFPPAHMVQGGQQQPQPQQPQQQQGSPPQAEFLAFAPRPQASIPQPFFPTVYMQTFNGQPQIVTMSCDPSQQSLSDVTSLTMSNSTGNFSISPSTTPAPTPASSYSSPSYSPNLSPATLSPEQIDASSSPSQNIHSPLQVDMQHSPQQQSMTLPQQQSITLPQQFLQQSSQAISISSPQSSPQLMQQGSPQSQDLQLVTVSTKKMEKLEKEVQDLKHELWLARQQRVATIPFLTNVQPRNMAMSMWRLPEAELVDFSAGFHTMLSLNVYDRVTFTSISPEELRNERTSLWAFFAREKPVLCGLLTKKPLITGKGEKIVPQTVCSLFHYGNTTLMQCTFWLN